MVERRKNAMAGSAILVAVAATWGSGITAQSVEAGRAGPRAMLDRGAEVALALSAAPPAVTGDATVLVWSGDGFETEREGSSGVTCYVARSWPDSLEPHCFDEVGSRTILPIHLRQMELWHAERTSDEIDAEIAEGLRDGTFRLPDRPAMSYMMSAGQRLIGDDGQAAGSWQPHLMIYFPWLTEADLGLGQVPSMDAAVVVDPGTPLSNIMIVVKEFVEVPEPTTTRGGP
jgi:hypothetical protein